MSNRETEANWEKELAEDVKQECEVQYGKVEAIQVEKDSEARSVVLCLTKLADGCVGRNICQIRFDRVCQEGHSRTQRPLVWR